MIAIRLAVMMIRSVRRRGLARVAFYAGLVATEADVRRIALALPETTEETWYRTPGYKVAGIEGCRSRPRPSSPQARRR